MNISTYEARIKALEDQLNPPVPGGSTGLLSVTVTPDIELSDGTMLNAKLAEMMPVEAGATQKIKDAHAVVDEHTDYTITATPGSKWYGVAYGGDAGEVAGDTAGAPVSLSLAPVVSGDTITLIFSAGASETGTEEGQESMVLLNLSHNNQTINSTRGGGLI